MRMIDKVAKAIGDNLYGYVDPKDTPNAWPASLEIARTAVEAMRKPTPGMIRAANQFCSRPPDDIFGEALIKYIINIAINEGYDDENDI